MRAEHLTSVRTKQPLPLPLLLYALPSHNSSVVQSHNANSHTNLQTRHRLGLEPATAPAPATLPSLRHAPGLEALSWLEALTSTLTLFWRGPARPTLGAPHTPALLRAVAHVLPGRP